MSIFETVLSKIAQNKGQKPELNQADKNQLSLWQQRAAVNKFGKHTSPLMLEVSGK